MYQHQAAAVPREPRRVSRLVVAPHPGDETLGCGGMLAKHGDDSVVVILAAPDEDRAGELRTAHRMLGGQPPVLLGLPERHVGRDMDLLVGMLAELLTRFEPAELYLPFPTLHHDHLVAYEAGLRSTCVPALGAPRPPVSVLLYDIGATEVADYPADVHWNVHEPLLDADVDRKVAAAIAYRSPLARGLRRGAEAVGAARSVPLAEQYALVRAPRGVARPIAEGRRQSVPAMAGSLP
jgi:LmbE family N-acetylglucosaminyl deacetylase